MFCIQFNRTVPFCCLMLVLLAGIPAHAANPIAFLVADANGDPYGQAPGTGQIDAFDSSGAFIGAVVTGLTVPSALTIGPNGYLYVANHNTGSNNGQVLAYDPSDNFATVNSGSIVNGVFASGLNGPGGILSDGTTLFVSELGDIGSFQGELVKHYDAGGGLISEVNNPLGSGSGQTGRTGMAFDDSGSLYVGAFLTGQDGGEVLRFDHIIASTAYSNTAAIFASGATGASGILFHDSNLFVAAQLGRAVFEYDSSGNLLNNGALISNLAFPSGLYDLGDANMLITEIGDGANPGQIDIYDFGNSNLTSGFITGTGAEDSIFQPTAVIAVPEPASAVLLACGIAILLAVQFRRRPMRRLRVSNL